MRASLQAHQIGLSDNAPQYCLSGLLVQESRRPDITRIRQFTTTQKEFNK